MIFKDIKPQPLYFSGWETDYERSRVVGELFLHSAPI